MMKYRLFSMVETPETVTTVRGYSPIDIQGYIPHPLFIYLILYRVIKVTRSIFRRIAAGLDVTSCCNRNDTSVAVDWLRCGERLSAGRSPRGCLSDRLGCAPNPHGPVMLDAGNVIPPDMASLPRSCGKPGLLRRVHTYFEAMADLHGSEWIHTHSTSTAARWRDWNCCIYFHFYLPTVAISICDIITCRSISI